MIFQSINIVDPIVKLFGENGTWLANLSLGSILIRLFLATILSGTIGIERAIRKHAAGFRTYILVCVAACLAMLAGAFLFETYESGDPARFGAQVISGIGFLGAGTILITSRTQVKGLTTAAGLWASACLGLTIGCGFYTAGLIGFVFISLAIFCFPKIEKLFTKRSSCFEIQIQFANQTDLKTFMTFIRENNLKIISLENNAAYANSGLSVYTIMISFQSSKFNNGKLIMKKINELDYVEYVEEKI